MSVVPSSKKEKVPVGNKMDTETSAQQFDHEDQNHHQQQQQHLAANNTDSSFTPLTDKVDDVFLSFRLILVLSVF